MNSKLWMAAGAFAAVASVISASPTQAAEPAGPRLTFTTLGTNSGPIPQARRSEPANLVRYGDQVLLVDVGDGAAEQLAKAGVPLGSVRAVILSHLHFDHTGGLFALLGLRYQAGDSAPLTIYGPPGTQSTVEGLKAAMAAGVSASATIRGPGRPALDAVKVVEIRDGARFQLGGVSVNAVENTHYATLPAGSPAAARNVSLSYRFDAPGRSILFTGDTGPSQKVERLAQGVDLLVSEIMEPRAALEHIKTLRPGLPEIALRVVEDHFRREHLSPTEAGRLAARAHAGRLVLTHDAIEPNGIEQARQVIRSEFSGPITFADDLQSF